MWRILGIHETNDIRKIKKAYAKMRSAYPAEAYPEKAKKIREAYENAINYAKNENKHQRKENIKKENKKNESEKNGVSSDESELTVSKTINSYIERIIDSLSMKKNTEITKTVQWLHSYQFYAIAQKREFIKALSDSLKRKYSGNVVILETIKNVYENNKFLDNSDLRSYILTSLDERIDIFKQEKNRKQKSHKKKITIITCISIIFFIRIFLIWGRIEQENRVPNDKEICSLIEAKYGVDIAPEAVEYEGAFLLPYEDEDAVYCHSIRYTTEDEELVQFYSFYYKDMKWLEEIRFNFENNLCDTYINKYLSQYTYRDHNSIIIDNVTFDGTQINRYFALTEDNIDSFVDNFFEFKEAYWSEIPVNSRNTEYVFNIIFCYKLNEGYYAQSNRDAVNIQLSTDDMKLDKETLRKELKGE